MSLPRVMIGMPNSGSIPWPTAVSLMSTVRVCDREGLEIRLSAPMGSSVVTWARDAVVGAFLLSDCTHLMWIDSDIVWRPADFLRLVGFGATHDLIGATYMLKREPPVCVVNLPDPENYEINGYGNIRVESLAMGFTLCKREVIEKIAATKEWMFDDISNSRYPDFFRLGRGKTGKPLGEDIAFYEDAAALGFKGWLDPSIKLGHVGMKEYTGDVIAALGLEDYVKQEKSQ
jgi:hypothetical protein